MSSQKLAPLCLASKVIAKSFPLPESPRPECQICCEQIVCVAVGRCVDRMCWLCALRLRRLHKTKSCPFCLAESAIVVLTTRDDPDLGLDDFDIDGWPANRIDETSGIYYETEEITRVVKSLLAIKCWLCPNESIFTTENNLQAHLNSAHKRKYCSVCLSGRTGAFLFEQFLFDPRDLQRHTQTGDPDLRPPLPAHPRCRWDHSVFYDETSYHRHLTMDHFICDLCNIDCAATTPQVVVTNGSSLSPVFPNIEGLIAHYSACHFPCPYQQCNMEVFGTPVELHYHLARKHGEGVQKSARLKMSLQELTRLAGISPPAEYYTAPPATSRRRNRPTIRRGPTSQQPSGEPRPLESRPPPTPPESPVNTSNPLLAASKEIATKIIPIIRSHPHPVEGAEPRFVQGFRAFLRSGVIKEFSDLRETILRRPPKTIERASSLLIDIVWLLWDKPRQEHIQMSWKEVKELSIPGEILFLNIVTAQESMPLLVRVLESWSSVAEQETKLLGQLGLLLHEGLLQVLLDAVIRAMSSMESHLLTDSERNRLNNEVETSFIDKGVDPSSCVMMKNHLLNLVSQPHLEGLDSLRPIAKRLANQPNNVDINRTWQMDCRRVFASWSPQELASAYYYLYQCQRASIILKSGPQHMDSAQFPELSDSQPLTPRAKSEWRRSNVSRSTTDFPALGSAASPAPNPSRGWSTRLQPKSPVKSTQSDVLKSEDFPPLGLGTEPQRRETSWGPGNDTRRCPGCRYMNSGTRIKCGLCGNRFY